jgi:hypothetical protein
VAGAQARRDPEEREEDGHFIGDNVEYVVADDDQCAEDDLEQGDETLQG